MQTRIIYNNKTNKIIEIISSTSLSNKEEISIYQDDIDDKLNKYDIVGMKDGQPIFKEKEKIKSKDEQIKELENQILINSEKEIGGIL